MTDGAQGAPVGNDNAVSHGLYRDNDKLRKRLDDNEERFLVEMSKDLLDRFPDDAEIGAYERMAIRNISLDCLKRVQANEWMITEDLHREATKTSERASKQYNRILNSQIKEMEKMGLIEESPAAREADASQQQANWMDRISEASESDE
jgi:hypothetical protein